MSNGIDRATSGRKGAPLTNEMLRILWAAREGRLTSNDSGRWVIEGESDRPERRARERLRSRGLISYGRAASGRLDYRRLTITEKGYAALAAEAYVAPDQSPASGASS